MDYAVEGGHDGVADLLLEHGGGLHGERLREGLVKAVEDSKLDAFKRLFKYARNGREAVEEAHDQDGRSLMLICLSMRSALNEGEDGDCEAMHQELLECGADGANCPQDSPFEFALPGISLMLTHAAFLQKIWVILTFSAIMLPLKQVAGEQYTHCHFLHTHTPPQSSSLITSLTHRWPNDCFGFA
jgi:hypothetical protein